MFFFNELSIVISTALSLGLFLLLDELSVEAGGEGAKELIVVALLNDLALLHHDDVVGVPDCRQSMGDHYCRD